MTSTEGLKTLQERFQNRCHLLPEIPFDLPTVDLNQDFSLRTKTPHLEFLKLVVYLMSNNLRVEDQDIGCEMVQLCQSEDVLAFLKRLLAHKQLTIMAMAEKLLVHAVDKNDELLTKILLDTGASPNARFDEFETQLEVAIARKLKNLVPLLVGAGANVDAISEYPMAKKGYFNGYRPSMLELSLKTNQLDVASILLDNNAGHRNGHNTCALKVAIEETNVKAIELLLKHEAGRTWITAEFTCLEVASATGNLQVVRLLLHNYSRITGARYTDVRTCIPAAAYSGNRRLVEYLLAHGAHPQDESSDGKHCLQLATNVEMVGFLLDHGADPNHLSATSIKERSPTALQNAAIKGNFPMVQLLLEHGADLNACRFSLPLGEEIPIPRIPNRVFTTLQAGVQSGNRDVVEAMLVAGISPVESQAGDYGLGGRTALQIASQNGSFDLAGLLIRHGAPVNALAAPSRDGATALTAAISSGNSQLISYLLEQGADVNLPSKDHPAPSPLQVAVEFSGVALVARLVELGADVSDSGALWAAVLRNDFECVTYLLDRNRNSINGLSVDYGRGALVQAAADQNHRLVSMLLDAGVDVKYPPLQELSRFWKVYEHGRKLCPRETAMGVAVASMNIDIVRTLLDYGADVNLPRHGQSELRSAIHYLSTTHPNALDMARLLIARGARLDEYDGLSRRENGDRTILQRAIRTKSSSLAHYLLSVGASINYPAEDYYGRTALQAAAENNDDEMVKSLIEKGADVNAAPSFHGGATALQFAAMNGNFKITQLLLNAGANMHERRAKLGGRTALEGAAEWGRLDMVQFLLDQAADTEGAYFEHQLCRASRLAQLRGHIVVGILIQEYQRERFRISRCQGHELFKVHSREQWQEFDEDDSCNDYAEDEYDYGESVDDEMLWEKFPDLSDSGTYTGSIQSSRIINYAEEAQKVEHVESETLTHLGSLINNGPLAQLDLHISTPLSILDEAEAQTTSNYGQFAQDDFVPHFLDDMELDTSIYCNTSRNNVVSATPETHDSSFPPITVQMESRELMANYNNSVNGNLPANILVGGLTVPPDFEEIGLETSTPSLNLLDGGLAIDPMLLNSPTPPVFDGMEPETSVNCDPFIDGDFRLLDLDDSEDWWNYL